MKRAADFRAEARAALKGHWRLAVGVGFLAMVLGGIAGGGEVSDQCLAHGGSSFDAVSAPGGAGA